MSVHVASICRTIHAAKLADGFLSPAVKTSTPDSPLNSSSPSMLLSTWSDSVDMASFLPFASRRATASVLFLSLVPAFIVYVIWIVLYRLYLDPLAKYPGPRLAALTKRWRIYKDCVQKQSFLHEVEKLHNIYGKLFRSQHA